MVVFWCVFIVLVLTLLFLDLAVFNRGDIKPSFSKSLKLTTFWVGVALVFNIFIYFAYEYNLMGIQDASEENLNGVQASLRFFTGYILEQSLSMDNVFVIAMVFSYFKVPPQHQHRVLFWGILGAIVFRAIMILLGITLIKKFDWLIMVFGFILVFSALRMIFSKKDENKPINEINIVKFTRRIFPVSDEYDEGKFTTLIDGKKVLTPLFLVLIVIETTDIIFAFDSIPAIFSVTMDSFIIFTSNIFALLGLRSLYTVLAAGIEKFKHLKISLIFILGFVGIKMILTNYYHIEVIYSLLIILGALGVGIGLSIMHNRRHR
jgi:tellurite resistance protein TerC